MAKKDKELAISINTDQAATSLAYLAKQIDITKEQMSDLSHTSGEYQKALITLKGQQSEYNQNLRMAAKEAVSAKGSYNDLVNQLARLKEEWKQADPKSEHYKKVTERVAELKDQLSEMDHEIGNWQRNVGNYQSALASLPGPLGAVSGGIKNIVTQGKALIATPIGATLAALVAALKALQKGFVSSEENMDSLSRSVAPFKAVIDGLTNVLQGAAKAAGWLGEKIAAFVTRIVPENSKLAKSMQANIDITNKEIEVRNLRRKQLVEDAKDELAVAELRAKVAQKDKYTAQERIAYLEQAIAIENTIGDRQLDLATKQNELLKLKAAQTGNDTEMNDALAESEANLYRVQAAVLAKQRELNAQKAEAYNSIKGQLGKETFSEKDIAALTESTNAEILKAEQELTKALNDEQSKRWKESEKALDEHYKASVDSTKKAIKDEELLLMQRKASYEATITATNAVLSSVAQSYQTMLKAQVESGKVSEEEAAAQFENVKALQYAQTWINTLAGMVSAFAAPDTVTWVQKVANAATVLSTGIASTIQIANTSLGSAASAATQTIAPAVRETLPVTRNVLNAQDAEELNARMASQKVVLVTTELEAKLAGGRQVQAQASF